MAYTRSATIAGSIAVTPGTTGAGATPSMANSGLSVIGNTTTEVFTLQPPVTGCQKTIVISSLTTTVLPVVRLSSAGGGISLLGATTGLNLLTVAATRSTAVATVIQMMGVNSTSWVITSICPGSSTATMNQALTASSG